MKNEDLTPQQIHARNEANRKYAIEFNLRQRFKTEFEFMRLNFDDREMFRRRYLDHIGFDSTIPMRKNSWAARLAYHRGHIALIRDLDFVDFYLTNKRAGREPAQGNNATE